MGQSSDGEYILELVKEGDGEVRRTLGVGGEDRRVFVQRWRLGSITIYHFPIVLVQTITMPCTILCYSITFTTPLFLVFDLFDLTWHSIYIPKPNYLRRGYYRTASANQESFLIFLLA